MEGKCASTGDGLGWHARASVCLASRNSVIYERPTVDVRALGYFPFGSLFFFKYLLAPRAQGALRHFRHRGADAEEWYKLSSY